MSKPSVSLQIYPKYILLADQPGLTEMLIIDGYEDRMVLLGGCYVIDVEDMSDEDRKILIGKAERLDWRKYLS